MNGSGRIAAVGELSRKLSPMWRPIYHEFLRWAKISRRTTGGYKRTEITVETDQILVVRKSSPSRAWCAACGREVNVLRGNDTGALPEGDPTKAKPE